MEKITIQAEGITCSGCATDVETVLLNTDGILDAKVIYATGMIFIEYDPSEIDRALIFSTIKRMGLKTRKP